MNTIILDNQITEAEQLFLGVAPWIVAGKCCECGKPVKVRVYGIRAELREIKLKCKDCNQ